MNQKSFKRIKLFSVIFLAFFFLLLFRVSTREVFVFKNTFAASCVCGDGYCNSSCENRYNCPEDCGGSSACVCGDGYCNPICENSTNCPEDCRPSCVNECSYSGQKERRCDCSRYLQERTCGNYDSDPCLEWSSWQTIQDCGVSSWTSEYRCSGNIVQRKYINRGCSNLQCYATEEWRNVEDCSLQGKICQNGQCVISCTNECSYSGQIEKRCSGNYVQKRVCGNYDSDPCLEWSDWQNEQNCGTSGWTDNYRCTSSRYLEREYVNRGCSNAQCFANSEWRQVQDCGTDSWTENYRCSGNWVQREKIKRGCSNNSCYQNSVWENIEDCSAQGKVCQNGQCVTTCTNECSYSGQKERRCDCSRYLQERTCGNYDSDPCLEWSSWQTIQDCGVSSWTSEYRCSGNIVQRKYINRGCSNLQCYTTEEWRDVEDCSLQGKICQNGQCVLPQCECTLWSNWRDKGCGQGGCAQNQMWQERTRCCTPSGCAPESETRCIEDPRCEPNDPISGTLSVASSTTPCIGEYVIFTISAKDNQGVEKVCLDSNCQSCNFQTTCTKTWQITKNTPGTFTFSGTVFGKKPDSSQESTQTTPPSITVTWRDCNRPPIANAGPDKEVLETQSTILEGSGSDPDSDPITFSWVCSGGTLSNANVAQPTFIAPAVSSDTLFSCTLTVTDSKGAQSSDSMNVLVRAQTLSVVLEAIPNSGSAPLNNVDLKATVSGTAIGPITYKFDCTGDGTFEKIITTNENPYTAIDICHFASGGTYNAKVYVERGAADPAWAQATILVSSPYPTVDLKVNGSDGPITVAYNSLITLTWTSNNVTSCQASGDWFGTKLLSGSETYNVTSQKTFIINCSGPGGTASDSVVVYVTLPSLNISLSASPSSGCTPLSNVSFTANVARDFTGNLTYYFDCTSDGTFEYILTTTQNSLTVSNICNYSSPGTFFAKLRVEGQGIQKEATTPINVYSCTAPSLPPSVDIKANGQDGEIFVSSGSNVNLTWSSTNSNYCQAFGDWSGIKSTAGSETIFNVQNSKIFTISCTGPGGTALDTVKVSILEKAPPISIAKHLRNVSRNTSWQKEIVASPGEKISVAIGVRTGDQPINRVVVKDIFGDSTKILRVENLKLDNVPISGNIFEGIEIGPMSKNQIKTITFDIVLSSPQTFSFGQTQIQNTAQVEYDSFKITDTANLIVQRREVAGITLISTGFLKNKFLDFILLPIVLAGIIIYFFKPYILAFEGWGEIQRRKIRERIAQKLLEIRVLKYKLKK